MKAYDLTGQVFGNWTVLKRATSKQNGRSNWLCECCCEAKTKRIVDGYSLKSGRSTSCGCLKSYSKGEQKIATLLAEANIPFEREKIFEHCKFLGTNYPARFDFWVNNQYVIEYDGEQHFKFIPHFHSVEEGFYEQQKRDNIKTKYCLDNNIKLIRIPYTEFNNINKILDSNLSSCPRGNQ